MPIERIQRGDTEITMVGTAHVSKSSVDEVKDVIRETKPDAVAVELCQARYDIMKDPKAWQEMDIFKVIKEKRASFLMANLVMASFQRRIGERMGIKPGDEMRAAIEEAEANGMEVALVDRNVRITLARAWRGLGFWEKIKLLFGSLMSIFEVEEIEEKDIERLKETDMLTAAVEEMAKHAPTIKTVLIDERDAYMARKIADIHAGKIVGVIGAGHMNGILSQIHHPVEDISSLEEIPPKKKGILIWVLPIIIIALLLWFFSHGTPKQGYAMLKWWIICTMTCTGLATMLAFPHPATVLVSALVAPVTTVIRAFPSGWFAGLSEAYLKKPKVSDFETIHDDIMKISGWWRNPITRILLVVMFSNIGHTIGVFLAASVIAKIAISGQ